mgnify:CR=1 FL=1
MIRLLIQRNPIWTYFVLTFMISWGGVLALGAPHGMPTSREQFEQLYPVVFLPYLLGPLISGILLTGLIDGKGGYRELLTRLFRWRVNLRWYAAALLIAPLFVMAILLVLSLLSPAYLPGIFTADNKLDLLLTGILIGVIGGGLMEEPGWTGFALPRLRRKYPLLTTGLIIGFLWGAWHFLPTYWGSGDSNGVLSLSLLLPPCFFYAAVLPAYRVLIVWVHENTNSLLLVILMHASLTASSLFILAPAVEGAPLFWYYFILAGALWGVVAAIKIINNRSSKVS